MMEAVSASETLVNFCETTQGPISQKAFVWPNIKLDNSLIRMYVCWQHRKFIYVVSTRYSRLVLGNPESHICSVKVYGNTCFSVWQLWWIMPIVNMYFVHNVSWVDRIPILTLWSWSSSKYEFSSYLKENTSLLH
jgi:hypothetical protein